MSSHTPGKWVVAGLYVKAPSALDLSVAQCLMGAVATTTKGGAWISTDEARANARLIAAAPDLLAALKRIELGWDGEPEDMDEAREAIAKAEGSSHA